MPTFPSLRRRATLQELFDANEGRLAHKWSHYFEIYERHLGHWRGKQPTVLEFGVSHGGSLDLLREWLGRGTTLVGVDIEPRTAQLERHDVHIVVADQSDREVLDGILDRYGPPDIVIDDGSHFPAHQIATLEALWPALRPGAVYLVEDTHTSYWPQFGGGLRDPSTFVEYAKRLADDLHAFHTRSDDFQPSEWTSTLGGLHVYDSVVVLDRVERDAPTDRRTGRPVFATSYGVDVNELIDDEHHARIAAMNRPGRRVLRALRHPIRTYENALQRRRARTP